MFTRSGMCVASNSNNKPDARLPGHSNHSQSKRSSDFSNFSHPRQSHRNVTSTSSRNSIFDRQYHQSSSPRRARRSTHIEPTRCSDRRTHHSIFDEHLTQSTHPTQPTQPTHPPQPTQPTQFIQPTHPTQFIQLTQPTQTKQTTQPATQPATQFTQPTNSTLGMRVYRKQSISSCNADDGRPNVCGEWDPCSVSDIYDANRHPVGTLARGRDQRIWVVNTKNTTDNGNNANECKQVKPQKSHFWMLAPSERPVRRNYMCCLNYPVDPSTGQKLVDEKPLGDQQWWKWSTLPEIERFCVRECGQGGDCLFASIAKGLSDLTAHEYRRGRLRRREVEYLTSISGLRDLAASQITTDNVTNFLIDENKWRESSLEAPSHVSGISQLSGLTNAYHWNAKGLLSHARRRPNEAADQVQCIIKTKGNLYWGDNSTIELMCKSPELKALAVGFLFFRGSGTVDPMYISSVPAQEVRHLIMLFNNANHHWRLVVFHATPNAPALTSVYRPASEKNLPIAIRGVLEASWLKDWRLTFGYSKPPGSTTI